MLEMDPPELHEMILPGKQIDAMEEAVEDTKCVNSGLDYFQLVPKDEAGKSKLDEFDPLIRLTEPMSTLKRWPTSKRNPRVQSKPKSSDIPLLL